MWPGHPCESHGCDECVVCRSGQCCGASGGGSVQPPSWVSMTDEFKEAFLQGHRPSVGQVFAASSLQLPSPVREPTGRPGARAPEVPIVERAALPPPSGTDASWLMAEDNVVIEGKESR